MVVCTLFMPERYQFGPEASRLLIGERPPRRCAALLLLNAIQDQTVEVRGFVTIEVPAKVVAALGAGS